MVKSFFAFITLAFLVGCISSPEIPEGYAVTSTTDSIGTLMHAPTLPPLSVSQYTPPETEEPALLPPPPPPASSPCEEPYPPITATTYQLDAVLDWDDHEVRVRQVVHYTNSTGRLLEEVVFQVEPNRQTGLFGLQEVKTGDDRLLDHVELHSNRMTVHLPEGLGQNCTVDLHISFTLSIPPILSGYSGRIGYFGYSQRQLNLGHWLPMVALYKDGWYTPRPAFIGEHSIAETSDFDLTLQILDAPQGIVVAAPGTVKLTGDKTWSISHERARDITVSISDRFRRVSKITESGTAVEVFYFPESEDAGLSPSSYALDASERALTLFEGLFAIEYPYKRLVIVEADFPDGMEFSGLAFVGTAWFTSWRGSPNEWLTVITVHEVAHQWWYVLLGNDPAITPYMDEAFCTYSELLYFENFHPDLTDWWWSFRVNSLAPEGAVDTNIYRYEESRPYINAVYLRGAQMLRATRTQIGDEVFFKWLQDYNKTYQFRIVTPADLWGMLPAEEYLALLPIRQEYLDQWEVLPEPEPTSEIRIEAPRVTVTPGG